MSVRISFTVAAVWAPGAKAPNDGPTDACAVPAPFQSGNRATSGGDRCNTFSNQTGTLTGTIAARTAALASGSVNVSPVGNGNVVIRGGHRPMVHLRRRPRYGGTTCFELIHADP